MAKKPKKKLPARKAAARRKGAGIPVPPPVTMTLDGFLDHIKTHALAADDAGGEKGACFIADPHTGQNFCIRTDPKTCTALKGVFVGGPCG